MAGAVSSLRTATAILKAKPIRDSVLERLRKVICIIVNTLCFIKENRNS